MTDPAGAVTSYEYDAMGRVDKETDALGNSQTFTYDKNGRIIGVTDKNGNTTEYTLDGNGNILCQTDALGHPSYFAYDSMNRLVKMTLYAGEETGADGETILTGEQITLYTYDHRGLVTTRINAAGDGKYYVYDELGSLISATDEDGYVTEHTYDALSRLSGTDYNGTKQVQYLYNGTGELVEMTDWNGVTTIRRDLLNRIEEVKDHNNRTTGYTWDAVGRLTSITYPGNMGTASFTYDAAGNQLTATDRNGKTFTFTYDEADNLTSKRYPNGEMERYRYDGLHQLIRMDEYALNGRQKTYTEYTYDAAGNRTSDCSRVPTTPTVNYAYTGNKGTWGGEWNSYTYDALNRLVKEYEHDTALTITYAYDSLGNKIYEKNSSDEKRYTYNELNQLVTKEAYNRTTNYEYDKRGNRILETSIHTQENRRTFEWDETNHLVKGTRGPDYGLYTSEYTYNGLGLRVNSTIMGPDKTIYDRDYVIDYTSPERNDLAEFNMGHYQWQGDKKVHDLTHLYNGAGQRLQTESTRYVEWAGTKNYTRYIHEDIMGSSYYYTNPETGYITNKHEYTTWGNNTKAPTYNYDPEYRASEPYFTGHPYDGSLNLYYAEARFYDPETGSFLSSDPAGSGLNWYQYCGSNPTTYVDVLGLELEGLDTFFFNKMEDSNNNSRLSDGLLNSLYNAEKLGFTDSKQLVVFADLIKYLNENPFLKHNENWTDTISIFAFEGLGSYFGDENIYHPLGQFGALVVVVKNGAVVYATPNASTLPDVPLDNIAVLNEGMYSVINWVHRGQYRALQVREFGNENNGNSAVAVTRGGEPSLATGINVHAAGDIFYDNKPWSTGCVTIYMKDYVEFSKNVGILDAETEHVIKEYKDIKEKLNPGNSIAGEFEGGYLIINREYQN